MVKHPETVARYPETLAELAVDAGKMQYDASETFLRELAEA